MAVLPCVTAFILAVLCSNPILKGAFVTIINSSIVALDLQITALILSVGRLNIANQILSAQINTLTAIFSTVQADLNLILDPLNRANSCETLKKINEFIQSDLQGNKFRAYKKKLYEFVRITDLSTHISSNIKEKEKFKKDLQDFVDEIATLCP